MKDFEIISHTADLQLRVYGATKQELFENALTGMFQAMGPQSKECSYVQDRIVCKTLPINRAFGVNAEDIDSLLVDFLSYALYLSDVHNEAYLKMEINRFTDHTINGVMNGIAVDRFKQSEIKAVTYHGLNIRLENGIWQTDIVFDV